MNEPWETSIFPIIKDYLMDNVSEDDLSNDEIVELSNRICKAIDKKYVIEKRQV